MTDNKQDNPGKGPAGGDAPGAKRPHAMIDLKATEVKSTTIKPADAKPAETKPSDLGPGPTPTQSSSEAGKPGSATSSDRSGAKAPDAAKPAAGAGASSASPAPKPAVKPAGEKSAAAPVGRTSSLVSHAAAAAAGGLMAVLAAGPLANLIGNEDGRGAGRSAQMQRELGTRLAKLEDAVRAGSSAGTDVSGKVENRLAKLDELAAAVRGLSEAQAKLSADEQALAQKISGSGATGDVAQRLAKLEDTLGTVSQLAGDSAKSGRPINLAPVLGRMGDLEASVETKLGALRKGVAQDLDARIKPAEEAVETVKSTAARLDREVAQQKSDQQRLTQSLGELKQQTARAETAAAAGQAATGSLKTAFDQLKGDVEMRIAAAANAAVAPVVGKVAAMETNLDSVVKRDGDRQANARRTLLALELANLRKAIEAGRPFAKELAEVQKLGAGQFDLKPLEAQSNERLPTSAQLQREFRAAANAVLDAEAGQRAEGSLTKELLARARSIVRVRKTAADAKGDDAESVIARMEAALKDGDLDRVMEEAGKLPEASAGPAKAWLQKVEARRSVDRALHQVEDKLKSTLSDGGVGGDVPARGPATGAPSKG